jgi:nucleotide-binding universal stress UspA family protein
MVVARTRTSLLIVPAYATEVRRVGELRFTKILLPLDCSPRAECIMPVGVALARAHGGELILSHVVPQPEMPRRMSPSQCDFALAAQLTERNRIEAERYLTDLQSHLSAQGVRSQVRVVMSPRRTRAICALADREDVDLVVVTAHGGTGDPSERYGGIAARLIQECSKPVIIVQDLPQGGPEMTGAGESAVEHPGH